MRLRLREGAVVEIVMWGRSKEDNTFAGKVLDVKEDEVVMIPQARLIKGEKDVDVYFATKEDQKLLSVDIGDEIHVNRQLIKCWRHIKIDELTEVIRFVKDKEIETDKPIQDYQVNEYDTLGYCIGNGQDFSVVPERYSNGGITISINDI